MCYTVAAPESFDSDVKLGGHSHGDIAWMQCSPGKLLRNFLLALNVYMQDNMSLASCNSLSFSVSEEKLK